MKVTGNPKGEFFARSEQPRGEVVHYVKANGTKNLVRFRVRTPTFTNIPPLLEAMKGIELRGCPGRGAVDRPVHRVRGAVIAWVFSR